MLMLLVAARMVAGFGSGAAFAYVSGMAGPNPLQGAFTSGVLMALAQAAFYQVSKPQLYDATMRIATCQSWLACCRQASCC